MKQTIMNMGASSTAIVPRTARTPETIVEYAVHLRKKDVHQVVSAIQSGHYEMASTFVWSKAMAALRRQLANLGAEFIGEMLQRPDINQRSDLSNCITDAEAVSLSEYLGMVSITEAMRLRHALETVSHFAGDRDDDDNERMTYEEALGCLRTCVQSVLGQPNLDVAQNFAEFRSQLEERTFKETDNEILNIIQSPYFFWKTTVSVLLALLKTASGAQLEHVSRNANLILPPLWKKLRKPERWQIGQTYAELHSEGRKQAVNVLKRILMTVGGFDYVPENLRSNTFTKAAADVLQAHEGMNNFYMEPEPMRTLANLGSTIPNPAFPVCMTATLSVWLGNSYGNSWEAEQPANRVLDALSTERWYYYLNECLPEDRRILAKLTRDKPSKRWIALMGRVDIDPETIKRKSILRLVGAEQSTIIKVQKAAMALYNKRQ